MTGADISEIPESQLLDIIFEPGFSTADHLTELSGRGVGMDIVRTNIRQVRGDIQVKTQLGVGTIFTIRVPFALSILRVMLLERAGFIFAVSVDSVREIIHFQPDLLTADGNKISWQSQTIPVVSIEQGINFGRSYRPFSLPGTPTISQPTVLIVGEDSLLTAFHIDQFWGEKEVTLRSIDSPMPLTPGFGNSIILGDGRVIPLVDLMQLANWISVTNRAPAATNPDSFVAINSIAIVPEKSFDSALPLVSHSQSDTILVIDDSINVRRYLAMMLEKDGYQVEQARDGQEAVDKLYAGLVVQGVLCDIEMPRLDGYGVLDTLRSHEVFADLPILMLSSRSSEKHRQLAMNLGASGYFTKPYTEPELLGTLKSLIAAAQ
jgi:chemosensory pili system protein ChpA (sensor histidine kinase/response regulator)